MSRLNPDSHHDSAEARSTSRPAIFSSSPSRQKKIENKLDGIQDVLMKIGKHLGVPDLDSNKPSE